MNVAVIADLHGNPDALINTLYSIGAIDKENRKVPGWHLVQVGDLLNMAPLGSTYRGFKSYDYLTLQLGLEYFDEILVGNHELFYTHNLNAGIWSGMARSLDQLAPDLVMHIGDAVRRGQFKAATCHNNTLITHAGLSPIYQNGFNPDPNIAARELCALLIECAMYKTEHPAITGHDSIFWMRPDEWTRKRSKYMQIVGHTPQPMPVFNKSKNCWFIDNAGYIDKGQVPAVVCYDGTNEWSLV